MKTEQIRHVHGQILANTIYFCYFYIKQNYSINFINISNSIIFHLQHFVIIMIAVFEYCLAFKITYNSNNT